MEKKNSLIRVLRWKKGFLIGSFTFYILFFCGIALFLYRVLKDESIGNCLDDIGMLLCGLYVPVFLVQLFESYLWGNPKTGEYIQSLPVKRMAVFSVSFIGNILVFTLAYLLFYLFLFLMFNGSEKAMVLPLQKHIFVAYLFTLELYMLVQLFMVNCKHKFMALLMALMVNGFRIWFFENICLWSYYLWSDTISSNITMIGSWELVLFGTSDDMLKIVEINGGILVIYILLILLSVVRQREDAVGLFYHRLFRFSMVAIVCFALVHFGWWLVAELLGHVFMGYNVYTEILWLACSAAFMWCLEQELAKRGGI